MPNIKRTMMGAAGVSSQSEGLFAWGKGNNGKLGIGAYGGWGAVKSSPVQVGELTTWSNMAAGRRHSLGVRTDGKLFSWGSGSYGGLGLGNTTSYSSPVQVGALTTWSKVAAGDGCTFGIKTDGTLWAWGSNQWNGQLGLGDATNRSSPVQVGSLTDWSKITAGSGNAFGIKTGGTLWSWGSGSNGAIGRGNTTTYSSPVQVGALTTWANISGSGISACLAVKTDGTMFSWGRNSNGELGLDDTTNRSSPVQIGALTTWSKVSTYYYHSAAIKTDGTLWSWGLGKFIGDDTTVSKSSPVQIGTQTNWSSVFSQGQHALAIASSS